jgi:hypothetical protein
VANPQKAVLEQIEELCMDALDPVLTRESVVQRVKEIYYLAADQNNAADHDSE